MTAGASRPMLAARPLTGWNRVAPLVLALAIVALHALQLRAGHDWADDYAMYLGHSLNLLAGKPYGDTGFVPNPWAVPGPPTYPPVYPVLIMPVVAVFGTNLQALKFFGVLMLGAGLLVAHALWKPRLGRTAALVLMAVLGLSPFFIDFRDEVRPDTLFLFLFLFTVWLGDRWTGQDGPWSAGALRRGLALGLVAYLAYGTRSVGIVLLPALWLVALWRLHRPDPTLLVASAVLLVLVLAQSRWLHADAGYAGNLTLAPDTLLFNSRHYLASFSVLWTNAWPEPWGKGLRTVLFVGCMALAAVGYLRCLRQGPGVLEVLPWLYLAPLVVYWVGHMIQQRYVMPLWPLLLYHAWVGGQVVWQRLGAARARPLVAGLMLLVLAAHGSGHARADRAPIQPGPLDADARQLYAWLRDHSTADAVVLSGRARAFALYTQRQAVSPFGYRDSASLWQLIGAQRVSHVVLGIGPVAQDMDYEHPDDLGRFVAAFPDRLALVLQTPTLALYQVNNAITPAPAKALP